MDLYELMKSSLPTDHCKQVNSRDMVGAYVAQGHKPSNILDFGCGIGRSFEMFSRLLPDAKWHGVDVEESPEVSSRTRKDIDFVTYDGEILPFEDEMFDLVYSHQVLEHVRKPELAVQEIRRVLSPSGMFVGQTSQFEPYHSYSMWNFTVYGFKRIIEDAGLVLLELRPSIDGFTLMERSYSGRDPKYSKFFSEASPRNVAIETKAKIDKKGIKVINHRKLQFCGQFCFLVAKK